MRNIFIITILLVFSLYSTLSFSECKVESNYTAIITDDGIFFGKIIEYRLLSIIHGDDQYKLPSSWDKNKVRISKNKYGEDICTVTNNNLEFLAEDKNYNRKIIFPDKFSFKCYCY